MHTVQQNNGVPSMQYRTRPPHLFRSLAARCRFARSLVRTDNWHYGITIDKLIDLIRLSSCKTDRKIYLQFHSRTKATWQKCSISILTGRHRPFLSALLRWFTFISARVWHRWLTIYIGKHSNLLCNSADTRSISAPLATCNRDFESHWKKGQQNGSDKPEFQPTASS